MCPARPREQHMFPSSEGCRHRIRLLRVLSHSHGGVMFCMEKQSGLRKKTRCVNRAQVFVSAVVRMCICRLHGAFMLQLWVFLRFFAVFSPSYQNDCAFSSFIGAFVQRRVDFLPCAFYNEANAFFTAHQQDLGDSFRWSLQLRCILTPRER